jgi:hypothetical protein
MYIYILYNRIGIENFIIKDNFNSDNSFIIVMVASISALFQVGDLRTCRFVC